MSKDDIKHIQSEHRVTSTLQAALREKMQWICPGLQITGTRASTFTVWTPNGDRFKVTVEFEGNEPDHSVSAMSRKFLKSMEVKEK